MHTRNIHTHIYMRMNFQEHFDRDTEDMRARVITKLSLIFCFSGVFFSTHEREKEKKATTFFQQRKRKKEQPLFSFFLFVLFFLVFLSVVCSTLDTFFPFLFLILPLPHPSPLRIPSTRSSSTTTKTTKYLSFARIYRRSLFEREKALSRERKERTGKEKLYSKKVRIWHF